MPIPTTIKHGDLCIELCGDDHIQIVRQCNGNAIRLSRSEWAYVTLVAQLHDWPVCAPTDAMARSDQ